MEILNVVQMLGFCSDSKPIWIFLGHIVNILQIAIPVIIVLLGTLDLGKAVMAGEDQKIKEAQKMLIMRLIYGAAVFFVVTIVQIVFGLVGTAGKEGGDSNIKDTTKDGDNASICFSCISTPKNC